MSPWTMGVLLVAGWGAFAWSALRRWNLLRVGKADLAFDQVGERLRRTLRFGLGQARMPRYRGAGLAHCMIFLGFLVRKD